MEKGPLHTYVLPLGMLLSLVGFLAFILNDGLTIGTGENPVSHRGYNSAR